MAPTKDLVDTSEVAQDPSIGLDELIDVTIDEEQTVGDNSLEDAAEDGDSYVVPVNNSVFSQIYDRKSYFSSPIHLIKMPESS